MDSPGDLRLCRQVLQAQEYWRLKRPAGRRGDVLNAQPTSYLAEMQVQLEALLDNGPWSAWKHRLGGAFLLRADHLTAAQQTLLFEVARGVLSSERGELATQLEKCRPSSPPKPSCSGLRRPRADLW